MCFLRAKFLTEQNWMWLEKN